VESTAVTGPEPQRATSSGPSTQDICLSEAYRPGLCKDGSAFSTTSNYRTPKIVVWYRAAHLIINLTPSSSRNSIRCSSKTCRIVLRFRACMGGMPLTRSLREIADREMRHWSDNSRTDQFSNARAARSCAPLIGGVEVNFLSELLSATRADPVFERRRTTIASVMRSAIGE